MMGNDVWMLIVGLAVVVPAFVAWIVWSMQETLREEDDMSHDSVRDQVVQQRRAVASRRPTKLEGEPRLGDVVAFVLSVTVLVYAIIDTVIGVYL